MFNHIRKDFLTRRNCLMAVAILLGVVFAFLFLPKPNLGAFQAWLGDFNVFLFFFILSFLPIFGFPVGVLYLAAGAKFGFATGLLVTALSIALHLWATHWLGSGFLRPRLERLLSKSKYRLPQMAKRDHSVMSLLTALLPGPHTLKNYSLVLSGVRLKPFLAVCIPVYIFRALTGLIVGGVSNGGSAHNLWFLAVHAVITFGVCGYVIKRLRSRHLAAVNDQEMIPALAAA